MASTGYGVDVRKRRWIAKERAFVPLLGSDYGAILNAAFEKPNAVFNVASQPKPP